MDEELAPEQSLAPVDEPASGDMPALPDAPAPPRAPILTGVLLFVASMLLMVGGSFAIVGLAPVAPQTHRILSIASQLLCWLLPAVLVARMQSRSVLEGLRIWPVRPATVLAAVVGGLCTGALSSLYLIAQQVYLIPESMMSAYIEQRTRIVTIYAHLMRADDPLGILLVLVAAAIVPGICEESIFRGVIQRNFEWRLRPWQAILLASLLFGLAHVQPANFVPLVMIGAYLGYIAWRTGSIIPSMAAHAAFNGMMFLVLRVYPQAIEERRFTSSEFLTLLPGGLLIAVFLLIIITRLNRTHGGSRQILLEQ